jgi:hypothetical protein
MRKRTMQDHPFNYLEFEQLTMVDNYIRIKFSIGEVKIEILWTYFGILDMFSAVSGLVKFPSMLFSTIYFSYNYYRMERHVV